MGWTYSRLVFDFKSLDYFSIIFFILTMTTVRYLNETLIIVFTRWEYIARARASHFAIVYVWDRQNKHSGVRLYLRTVTFEIC